MSKYLEVPPELQSLIEKRCSEDRRKRKTPDPLVSLGTPQDRRSGKDRRGNGRKSKRNGRGS